MPPSWLDFGAPLVFSFVESLAAVLRMKIELFNRHF